MATREKKLKRRARPDADSRNYKDIEKRFMDVRDIENDNNVVLYGPAGTGKTTLACTFPKPILLMDVNEKGTDSVKDQEDIKVIHIKEWQDLESVYWFLKKNPGKFKTLVWDTITQSMRMSIRKTMEEAGKDVNDARLGDWGSVNRKQWGDIAGRMGSWVTNFRDLEGINVVYLAHDRVNKEDDDGENEGIQPMVGPRVSPSVASVLDAGVNIIGSMFIRETIKKKKVGPKKNKIKVIRKVQYCMRLGPHAHYITKIRSPKKSVPPDVLVDPTYEDLKKIIDGVAFGGKHNDGD